MIVQVILVSFNIALVILIIKFYRQHLIEEIPTLIMAFILNCILIILAQMLKGANG